MSSSLTVQHLIDDVTAGRCSRRQAIRTAIAAGLSMSALFGGIAAISAGAQGTPAASPAASPAVGTPAAYTPAGPQVDKLLFWTRSSPDSSPAEWSALQAVTTKYTEYVGTPIELVTVPDADFKQKMTLAGPSGDGPDVYGPVAHDWLGEFAIQNLSQPWAEGTIAAQNELSPISIEACTVNAQVYGVPLFSEALGLMVNTNLLPEAPTTWDDLVAKATELTTGDQSGFLFPLLEQYYQGPFFYGNASYVFGYADGKFDTNDVGLNNAGGVTAAKMLRDMYANQTPPLPEALLDQASAGGFIDGQFEAGVVAMTIAGPWRETAVTAAGVPYTIAPLPTLANGTPLTPFVGIQAMCANPHNEKLGASIDFINFMASGEGVSLIFQGFNKAPVRTTLTAAAVALNPNFEVWIAQADAGVPMPNVPAMSQVWEPWGEAMTGIITNAVSDEEVQALLDGSVESIKAAIEASQG